MILIQTITETSKPKASKSSFAVHIDTFSSLPEFNNLIKDSGLESNKSFFQKIAFGDFVVFGTSKNYDYKVICECELQSTPVEKIYALSGYKAPIVNSVETLVKKRVSTFLDTDYIIEVKVEKPVKRPRGIVVDVSAVTIHDNFVKIGYDLYKIKKDYVTNSKYIVVDGEILLVKTGFFGNKYLA